MARKKVLDLNADTTISFETPGQEVNGYYIGFKTVNTSFGESKLHILQTDKGAVGAWGSAQLDAKLKTVKPGTMAYITFIKKVKIPKGTQKLFDVEYDDELSIDVGNTQVNYSTEASDPLSLSESDDGADHLEAGSEPADTDQDAPAVEEEEEQEEAEQKVAAKLTAAPRVKGQPEPTTAERKASAQALLNKARAGTKLPGAKAS